MSGESLNFRTDAEQPVTATVTERHGVSGDGRKFMRVDYAGPDGSPLDLAVDLRPGQRVVIKAATEAPGSKFQADLIDQLRDELEGQIAHAQELHNALREASDRNVALGQANNTLAVKLRDMEKRYHALDNECLAAKLRLISSEQRVKNYQERPLSDASTRQLLDEIKTRMGA